MRVGFIGLGHLGKAISKRLSENLDSLIVWNRSIEKAKDLGFQIAPSPAELMEVCDTVFMCLFDSNAVRKVLKENNGLLSRKLEGKIIVDLTTNHFKDVLDFHNFIKNKDGIYLESPVLGSIIPASKGTLTVLVSGDEDGFKKVEHLLQVIGKHIFYLKEPGIATKMKLINNLNLGAFMATIAESLSLGESIGLDKGKVLDILSVGGGDSLVLNAKKEKLKNEDYSPHFSNSLMYKDLYCLQDLAYELKKPIFMGSIAKELFAKTFTKGIENEDLSAIYKILSD